MRTILILVSFGILAVSGGTVERKKGKISTVSSVAIGKPYKDHSTSGSNIDLRQLLDAVEGNNNLQQYGAPIQQQYGTPIQQAPVQQYAIQQAPLQQYAIQQAPLQQYAIQQAPIQPQYQIQQSHLQQQYLLQPSPLQQQYVQYSPVPQPQPIQQYTQLLSAGIPSQQYGAAPSLQYSPAPSILNAPAQKYGAPSSQILPALGAEPRSVAPAYQPNLNSAPLQPASKYGAPIQPNFNSGPAQPGPKYGAPVQPNFNSEPIRSGPQYGAPAQGSYNIQGAEIANSQNGGFGSLGLPGDNFGADQGDFKITRDVSVHIPPADSEIPPPRQFREPPRLPKKKEKHYKVIFIRAPTQAPPEQPIIPEIPEHPETKTLVYVLVKKPEQAPPIIIPTPEPPKNTQPEVYFIKYRHPSEIGGAEIAGGLGLDLGEGPVPIGPEENLLRNSEPSQPQGGY